MKRKKNQIKRYLGQFKTVENQTYIITGANSGLGYSTTKHLISLGAKVIMACRNLDKAKTAKDNLLKLYPEAKIIIMHYDQADFKSIDLFVKEIHMTYSNFNAMILTAGIYHPKKGLHTKNGFPLTMGTNYIGVYYLLKKLKEIGLLDHIRERRIIFIGSLSWHKIKQENLEDVMTSSKGSAIGIYARSKTLLGILAYLLSRHDEKNVMWLPRNVKVLLMHPGITSTNIVGSMHSSYPKWFSKLARGALSMFVHRADKAALGVVSHVLDEEVNEDEIVVPRGVFQISGYPRKKSYPKNLRSIDDTLITKTRKIIDNR